MWSIGCGLDVLERQPEMLEIETHVSALLCQMLAQPRALVLRSVIDTYQCLTYRSFRVLRAPESLLWTWISQTYKDKEQQLPLEWTSCQRAWTKNLELLRLYEFLDRVLDVLCAHVVSESQSGDQKDIPSWWIETEDAHRALKILHLVVVTRSAFDHVFEVAAKSLLVNAQRQSSDCQDVPKMIFWAGVVFYVLKSMTVYEKAYDENFGRFVQEIQRASCLPLDHVSAWIEQCC